MRYFAAVYQGAVVNTRAVPATARPFTHAVVIEGANGPHAVFFTSWSRAITTKRAAWPRRRTHIVRVIEVSSVLAPGHVLAIAAGVRP
jgi:hypothetical protein